MNLTSPSTLIPLYCILTAFFISSVSIRFSNIKQTTTLPFISDRKTIGLIFGVVWTILFISFYIAWEHNFEVDFKFFYSLFLLNILWSLSIIFIKRNNYVSIFFLISGSILAFYKTFEDSFTNYFLLGYGVWLIMASIFSVINLTLG